jgi:hypothetical protein
LSREGRCCYLITEGALLSPPLTRGGREGLV